MNLAASLTDRAERLTSGTSLGPLATLTGLNFVDEFDRIAFATLTPEIRDAFGLSDTGIGAVGLVAGGFILIAALPVGLVADRVKRVHVVLAGAAIWATMSILTGVVTTVALLLVVRLVSGIGRITTEVVHPSLLTDYYEPEALPRVFQIHQLANPVSQVAGVAAGLIATQIGWRWAFLLLALPTFVLLAFVARLREPERGESIDAGLAVAASALEVPFREGLRRLVRVRTLRRLWFGSFLLGTVAVAIPLFLALFFERVYAFDPVGRGAVAFIYGVGVVVGLFVGGALAERATDADDVPRLAAITGASGLWFAASLGLMVGSPWSGLSVAAVFLLALAAGSFRPAYYPLVGLVAPPKIRSQAYAIAIVFLAVGAFAGIAYVRFAETAGYRVAIGTLALTVAAAGVIAWSARPFVDGDVARATASLRDAAGEVRT